MAVPTAFSGCQGLYSVPVNQNVCAHQGLFFHQLLAGWQAGLPTASSPFLSFPPGVGGNRRPRGGGVRCIYSSCSAILHLGRVFSGCYGFKHPASLLGMVTEFKIISMQFCTFTQFEVCPRVCCLLKFQCSGFFANKEMKSIEWERKTAQGGQTISAERRQFLRCLNHLFRGHETKRENS